MDIFEALKKSHGVAANKARGGEIKFVRDGQSVTLPAYQFDLGTNFLLVFAALDASGKIVETVGFIVKATDIGKEVHHPQNGSWIQALFNAEENFATRGVIKVNEDVFGATYYGTLSAEFTEPDATIRELKDGIFSFKYLRES
ncbi:hypothetical protein [Pseudomonas sp. efr-133-TYG-5]|jgi:hypothetical protein|uniref:hypothetical protein n=1 Tax=Pseudomonas sp. efr-133-TYG-5 TaxID=3040310 RepID=UPI002553B9DF|nr:hypothetical protein [Pseudomonas sp. efr-133-TYG-5]